MRYLSILFALALALSALAHGSSRRTHIVTSDNISLRVVQTEDGEHWASYQRDGVRYVTEDASVLVSIEKAMEPHRQLSREHSRLGRKHSELGREHSALGREHSRLGREHSRVSRDRNMDSAEMERRHRELEDEQRKLEEKQRKLEDRQRDLESEQRELESKQRAAEREMNEEIERIFERAIREGKAKRD